MVTIRPEQPQDEESVQRVNREAFGRESEARLVDLLRVSPAFVPGLSLVALDAEQLVGHVLFTKLSVAGGGLSRPALALAPLAVLPAWQNRGIGSALVRRGLSDARELGHRAVLVLGHPEYYPRFGFRPAQALGIHPPFSASPEAFLVLALDEGGLQGLQGRVEYPPEFGGPWDPPQKPPAA